MTRRTPQEWNWPDLDDNEWPPFGEDETEGEDDVEDGDETGEDDGWEDGDDADEDDDDEYE